MNKAYTLLEIVVVLSVVGVIAAISTGRFAGIRDEAKVSQAQSEVKKIETAVIFYYLSSNPHAYPPTSSSIQNTYLVNAAPRVISIPVYDPFGSNSSTEYDYDLSSGGKCFVIWSVGPRGVNPSSVSINDAGTITGLIANDIYVTKCSPAAAAPGTPQQGTPDPCYDSLNCNGNGPCPAGQSCLNCSCVNLSPSGCGGDPNNCGGVGHICSSTQLCISGICVDKESNMYNCGSCGNNCNNYAYSSPACCNGGCTDTSSDPNNCGGCGDPCAGGDTCTASSCVPPSESGG